jgi:hypothetical protein
MRRSSRSGSRSFADLLAVKRGGPARRTYGLRAVPGTLDREPATARRSGLPEVLTTTGAVG